MSNHQTNAQQWLFSTEPKAGRNNQKIKVVQPLEQSVAEKVLKQRQRAASEGNAPLAAHGLLNCEMKGTLLPREAMADLRICDQQLRNLVDEGLLDTFPINSKDKRERVHLRIISASVIRLINSNNSNNLNTPKK